ncbi:hypothetical protein GCM10009655_00180 [Rhodoglobus aureus]|uniref:Uncharacterized protein n=2 Tax=Rhodoglobus aureus TaxID=191497 RepID=A0ABP4FZK1_9MICO
MDPFVLFSLPKMQLLKITTHAAQPKPFVVLASKNYGAADIRLDADRPTDKQKLAKLANRFD